MFRSVVLEVAIGLAHLYLLLSLACMAINEWIAGGLTLRSKTLEAGIRNLLDDPQGTGLASKFFKHALIQGLTGPDGRLPSRIFSPAFATVLLDVVIPVDPAGQPLRRSNRPPCTRLSTSSVCSINTKCTEEAL